MHSACAWEAPDSLHEASSATPRTQHFAEVGGFDSKDSGSRVAVVGAEPSWSRLRTPSPDFIHRDARFVLPRPILVLQPAQHVQPWNFYEAQHDDSVTSYGSPWQLRQATYDGFGNATPGAPYDWSGNATPGEPYDGDEAPPITFPTDLDVQGVEPEDVAVPGGCRSRGSRNHPHGCAPACKYLVKKRGCKDGAECDHCHECVWVCKRRTRDKLSRRCADMEKRVPGAGGSGVPEAAVAAAGDKPGES